LVVSVLGVVLLGMISRNKTALLSVEGISMISRNKTALPST